MKTKLISIIITVILLIPSVSCFCFAEKSSNNIFERMLNVAESIVNFEWKPSQNIDVWNENPYNGKMYFPSGETIVGMPYTLFSWEFGFDSLLSLEQFKKKANVDYSITAYCNSMGEMRTGPVYGSCCATFVSEVFGGSFMNEGNPRYDNCGGIENSQYATTYYNIKMSDIEPGDAIINTSRGHIVWVGAVDSNTITIYEQTPPVARKVIVSKTSVDSNGYMSYNGGVYNIVVKSNELLGENDELYSRSDKFPTPINSYTIQTGKTLVYDSINGNIKANKIYDSDLCEIQRLYENGWCYVTFPLDVGGIDSGYVRTSVFFDFDCCLEMKQSTSELTTYARNDLSDSIGHIGAKDDIYILTKTDTSVNILYPLFDGGYKVGWISIEDYQTLNSTKMHNPGDINDDGFVNSKDLTRLMKYLSGENVEINAYALDVNGDEIINNKDLTRLMKYLAGEDVEIH